jgi:hypothetical protein
MLTKSQPVPGSAGVKARAGRAIMRAPRAVTCTQ